MNEPQKHIYEFGNFRLDAAKRLLSNDADEIVPLMPKAFDTLFYLVRHNGRVIEKDELMREIWTDAIVEENNLVQNISILRRIFGEKPGEHRFIVTVPGHGYKFVAPVRISGSAPHVPGTADTETEFSALRNEPETGNPQTQNRDRPPRGNGQSVKDEKPNRFWLAAVFGVAVIGLAIGLYAWRKNEKGVAARIKTVAVLPFKPLVPENRNAALELGMADSLISKLGGGEAITVRPLSAVRRYNSDEQDSLTAGRELNVEAVVDGTIQTSGERIRVSARLIQTSDGKQLWTGQFDENFADIFVVQDSISTQVAAALKIRLGRTEQKKPTENIEAYQLYMKGRYHALNLTRAETDKAIAYFRQALDLDPNYALAYVGLARAYIPMALTSDVPSREVLPKAQAAALRAIGIDDTLAEAYVALGLTMFWYDWDWASAEKQYRRALELDPNNAEAHFGYAHLLSNTGRHEQALGEIKIARELDPVSLATNALEGQILFFAGKYDESLDRLNKTTDLNPNFWLSHLFISRVYAEKGMHAQAVAAAVKAKELSQMNSESIALIGYSSARSGDSEKGRAVLEELLKLSETRYVPPYNFALIFNGLGESDKALDYLEKGFAEKDVRLVFLKVEPKWNNLRTMTRFNDLMKRMNLIQ